MHKTGSTTTTTDYCGNVVYENGSQKYLLTEEGYITLVDSKYHYYLKDHQGNNRVVISSTGTVEETNHYYPFGGVFAATNNVQSYKYNGKEFDSKNGLNWYDYGARHYDVALGRFVTVDPMAEKYYGMSPYAYCGNSPVNRIDPTGMIWDDVKEAERLKRMIDKRISSLNNDINKYQSKIESGGLSKKKLSKLTDKLSEAHARVANLEQSKQDIDLLGNDPDNTYAFNRTEGGIHRVWQGDDGKVYIDTSSDALSIHEITHVRQSLESEGLEFHRGNLKNPGNGIKGMAQMEVDAYKMQYSFDRSFPGHTQSLNGIDIHSVGDIVNNQGQPVYKYIQELSKAIKRGMNVKH